MWFFLTFLPILTKKSEIPVPALGFWPVFPDFAKKIGKTVISGTWARNPASLPNKLAKMASFTDFLAFLTQNQGKTVGFWLGFCQKSMKMHGKTRVRMVDF